MTPSPNRQAVIVGLFVAAAVGILAGGVLTIGDLNDTFTRKVGISAVFDEVGGLQEGDNIWFSGVKVGVVTDLAFHPGSKVQVRMKIDRKATEFIHDDVLAKVGSDGLIGNKIVVLYGGTPEAPIIAEGTVLEVGVAVSTDQIMATLQENNNNLLALTTDLKTISGKIAAGEGNLGKLLGDDALYTNVSDTVTTLNAASGNAEVMTASLSTFAGKLNQPGNLPNDIVTDKTTYASLTTTVDKLQLTGEKASVMMDGLAKATTQPGTPVGTLLNDQEAGADLKATLDNLSRGSVLLAEDLEAAQHNFLLRGFFVKKEKAEAKALKKAKTEAKAAEAKAKTNEKMQADSSAPEADPASER